MKKKRLSLVLFGTIHDKEDLWEEWYHYAKNKIKAYGFTPDHLDVIGESFKGKSILTVKRSEKKLLQSLKEKKETKCIAVDSLYKDYGIAAFDYHISFSLTSYAETHDLLIDFPESDEKWIQEAENLLNELKAFMDVEEGCLFEFPFNKISLNFVANRESPSEWFHIIKTF
jgi:hypothetical protein